MGLPKTSDHIQIKIKMPNPSQEPPVSSKAPNEDLMAMDVLCTFKIKIESQNSEYGCTKDQWPYPNQYQDAKPLSGTSSILQSPKSWLKGYGCSEHLQNQGREPKFGSWVYQRPGTISKSRSRCQTPVRNLQRPPKPQVRTKRTWMLFVPSKSRKIAKNWIMSVSKISHHIQIKIKIPNPGQEHSASSKAPNEDFEDQMRTLRTWICFACLKPR